jgi:hypothetical protein
MAMWQGSGTGGTTATNVTTNTGVVLNSTAQTTNTTDAQYTRCFWLGNVPAGITTITNNNGTSYPAIAVAEYTGASPSIDAAGVQIGPQVIVATAGGAINAAAITTTNANDAVVSMFGEPAYYGNSTITAAGGATTEPTASLAGILLTQDQLKVAAGAITATATSASGTATYMPCVFPIQPSTSVATPTAITFTPTSPVAVTDNYTLGEDYTLVSVSMSDGSTFTGSLSVTSDTGASGGICSIVGNFVAAKRSLTSGDIGTQTCGITATQ